MEIKLDTWSEFKTLVIARGFRYQQVEVTKKYYLFAVDGGIGYSYELDKIGDADQTDFETNYKAGANLPVQDMRDGRLHVAVPSSPGVLQRIGTALQCVTHAEAAIAVGRQSSVFAMTVPSGYVWHVYSWNGSGDQPGHYELVILDRQGAVKTEISTMESVGTWAGNADVTGLSLSADAYQGSWALRADVLISPTKTPALSDVYSPALDLSAYERLSCQVKPSVTNVEGALRLHSGIETYLSAWRHFPLDAYGELSAFLGDAEDAGFDTAAIDKIEILFRRNGGPETSASILVDDLVAWGPEDEVEHDAFYAGAYTPYSVTFPSPVRVTSGLLVAVVVTNAGVDLGEFSVSVFGAEEVP